MEKTLMISLGQLSQHVSVIFRPCIQKGCRNHSALKVIHWPSLLPIHKYWNETVSAAWRN